ncbi:flagellar assembly peptidoglycan hydrolase FlgJ [Inmirania thermothiophila]|uniref:Peptidoglycan hydrolase FlgJ n=1 Tax=Inmirania thermothiophila TaxID=1750597 RepID=A0A3N1Y7X0_9GAMM|nr:flagellar assembly peptidoglycan hydrolase FlgJ [Inmirania thermothiophila]ROR34914.1 flagellar protein FlgJ [Inmirania thermothiophila]
MRPAADSAGAAARVYHDLRGLAALRADAARGEPGSLREAAEQFEALLVQMMVRSMRAARLAEDPYAGPGGELYTDLLDRQLAIELAARERLGLAEAMVRQLEGAAPRPPAPPPAEAPPASRGEAFASPAEFVQRLRPHAERAARALGTRPELLLAQAALETGWGRRVIRRDDGTSSHNLFNIKADARWQGPRVEVETTEYRDGRAVRERAAFRAYGSWAEAFDDYVAFLRASPRYREAVAQAGRPAAFVRALAEGGYATDPDYTGKVLAILARLEGDGFKSAAAAPTDGA